MTNELLELNVAAKHFKDHRVIDQVAFRVEDGQVVTLVGPSGCGKSTL